MIHASALHRVCKEAARENHARRITPMYANPSSFTAFFRNPETYVFFGWAVLPHLVRRARSGAQVRIWSAACSDGREPYSLAMMIANAVPAHEDHWFEVLGTDLSLENIAAAKAARWMPKDFSHVRDWNESILGNHLEPAAGLVTLSQRVRSLVRFHRENLLDCCPDKEGFDVVYLRNVMCYLPQESWEPVIERVGKALRPGGYLFPGEFEQAVFMRPGLQHWMRRSYREGIVYCSSNGVA